MRVSHIAIWSPDIERLKAFYVSYFGAVSGNKYENETFNLYSSYYLSLAGGGCKLKLMQCADMFPNPREVDQEGLTYIAISLGSSQAVDDMVARLEADGVIIVSDPREGEEGDYEAIVFDPDGNLVALTV